MRKRWMSWIARGRRTEEDYDEELAAHIELATEEGVASGYSPAEARRRARLALGDSRAVVENIRDFDPLTAAGSVMRDVMHGLRRVRQRPMLSIAAILTLALGIGANTAVFTLLYGVLLRPLPAPNAQELVTPRVVIPANEPQEGFLPYRMMRQLRENSRSYSGFSIWFNGTGTLAGPDGSVRLYETAIVSGESFQTLGIRPYAGRLLTPEDDVPGVPAAGFPIVIGYRLWRDFFGADRTIIGRRLRVTGQPAVIVGIAPADFQGVRPGVEVQLYAPLPYATATNRFDYASPSSFAAAPVIARLKPGVTIESANAELAAMKDSFLREFVPPAFLKSPRAKGISLVVRPAKTGIYSQIGFSYSTSILLMQALVGIVLVLCCVNVSGLMLSRVHERRHEFAVRTAIGAARWRVIRQCLAESFVIALAGAALGAAFAWYGVAFLLPFFRHPNSFASMVVYPDGTVFLVTGALAVVCTIGFGIVPAWASGRSSPGSLLKARSSPARHRSIGRFFVPVQVSLSLVLVTLAALLSQSLIRIRTEHRGFELDKVTIQTPPIHLLGLESRAKLDIYQRMIDSIQRTPGIASAAITWYTPMTGSQANSYFEPVGGTEANGEGVPLAFNEVGPGYFRTMGTRILAGTEFGRTDRSHEVCVINQAAARRMFGGRDALGRYVRTADPQRFPTVQTCRVTGIAEDAKFANLRDQPPPTLYFPIAPAVTGNSPNFVFLINSPSKTLSAKAYAAALAEIAPTIPLVLFVTLREQMDASIGRELAITLLSSFFAAVALALSALGLYGMLASNVAQRTSEIGLRMALGAQRPGVIWMILANALRHVGVGIAAGGLCLYFAVRMIQSMLYGVSAFDAMTLAGASGVMVATALAAALWPALRAASVDPIQALRVE